MYMSTPQFYRPVLLFALLVWVFSCTLSDFEDLELAEHEADFAFPLFQTSLNLKDLMDEVLNDTLPGDTLLVNADGTMTLIYSGDLVSKPALDLFSFFPDTLIPLTDSLAELPLDDIPNSLRVDRVDFSGGTIALVAFNSWTDSVDLTVTIPQMLKNGQVFEVGTKLAPGQFYFGPTVPIAGYVLAPTNNTLVARYVAVDKNGLRVKLEPFFPNPEIDGVALDLDKPAFSYMQGYWGYEVYPLTEDTIEIDLNQTDLDGDVYITDPKVTFTVANSWGFPTQLLIEKMVFVGRNGVEIPLQTTALPSGALDLAYPSYAAGEVGQTKYTKIFFDKNNSNIDDIFNSQPVQLIYDIDGIANVEQDPDVTGFITDSSVVDLLVSVELLLEGSALNFGAEQTLDLNFGEYDDLDTSNIVSVEFKLVTENEMPISSDLQIYFLDDQEQPIDSLFLGGPQTMLRAAPIDNNGVAVGVERTETFIPMSTERFNRIRTSPKAQLQTYFTTAQGGQVPVKLIATQDAVVKMGIRVRTRF